MGKNLFIAILILSVLLLAARAVRRLLLRKKRRQAPYRKVVFLDFDGVLHRGFAEDFEHVWEFEKLLKAHPDTSVVISSDWRRGKTLDQLKTLFSPSVREQFIGLTPELSFEDRQLEIETFCATHGILEYLIIDDSQALFRPGNPHAYFTNHHTGLTAKDLEWIDAWMSRA